jgi:hypothetical protein
MSKKITAKDCRNLLSGKIEGKELTHVLLKTIASLSVGEKFNLAKELSRELSFYYELDSQPPVQNETPKLSSIRASALTPLARSFEIYDSISIEEYAQLMESNSYIITASLMKNDSFPITFLIYDSWVEKHVNESGYWYMKEYVRITRKSRKPEVVNYCRNLVPNSENMSNDIVLKVAGIHL